MNTSMHHNVEGNLKGKFLSFHTILFMNINIIEVEAVTGNSMFVNAAPWNTIYIRVLMHYHDAFMQSAKLNRFHSKYQKKWMKLLLFRKFSEKIPISHFYIIQVFFKLTKVSFFSFVILRKELLRLALLFASILYHKYETFLTLLLHRFTFCY